MEIFVVSKQNHHNFIIYTIISPDFYKYAIKGTKLYDFIFALAITRSKEGERGITADNRLRKNTMQIIISKSTMLFQNKNTSHLLFIIIFSYLL